MNYKFTSDGRKVAIVGALNAKETIVQEIFVNNGTEFPAGEHFVVKTLLDAPAETYKAKEERRVLDSIKKLEDKKKRLHEEIKEFRFKASAATAKIKWIDGITDEEVRDVFENLKSMLCGEYTHVVFPDNIEIKEWDHKLFSRNDDYNHNQFESLRLISLFGNWNKRLSLNWKVNSYQDGGGSTTNIIPCKSLEEAIEKAKEVVYAKDYLSHNDYKFCIKYGIPIEEEKNSIRIAKQKEGIERDIIQAKERLAKLEDNLKDIG